MGQRRRRQHRGNDERWGSALIIGCFVASAVLLVLFVLAERRTSDPLLELSLFGKPSFTGAASDPQENVTVKIYEGEKTSGTVVAEASAPSTGGQWTSGPVNHELQKGKHTYTAVASQKSSLGNPEGSSTPVTFVVYTEPP